MGLEEYNKKRKFDKTSEPKGEIDKTNGGRFVIQRHNATRLHYDLRLEMEGVLKSWAIPKGPSLNAEDKRLAVQTEDHPVKYLTFEGKIPKGNYGAGSMTIWDKGSYSINKSKDGSSPISQLKKGNLKLKFNGSKLKGDFALVSFRKDQNNWLLIKKSDEHAVKAPYDSEEYADKFTSKDFNHKDDNKLQENKKALLKPMFAKTGKKIADLKGWIYELKWDGYRTMAEIDHGEVNLFSRNGLSLNEKFAPLLTAFSLLDYDVILDGEVVILNKDGTSNFQKLQNSEGKELDNLFFYAFDLVYLNGHSTVSLPLKDRKELLKQLIENSRIDVLRYCDHIETLGLAFYEKALSSGFEGVMAKDYSSTYYSGVRSEYWLKFKGVNSMEAIICGYTESDNREFGSLILGAYEGKDLKYIGNCGSGFSAEKRRSLLKTINKLEVNQHPFNSKPNLKGRKPHWVSPILVCEVNYAEITKSGILRHPVFKYLRNDKNAVEVDSANGQNLKDNSTGIKTKISGSSLAINGKMVSISNPAKVYFPGEGIRKYDLIDYYIQVADTILPYLKERPQNLHRHPNGIAKEGFYQKDSNNLPKWVETIALHSKSNNNEIDYMLCQNEATLIFMVNLGCIELNPWNSTIQHLNNPTYTIIDIDPTDKTPFTEVVEVAQVAKEVLDAGGVKSYCKTSGSSGLHIYIPLASQYSYNEARDFAKLICHFIHQSLPKTTSMERAIKARNGKIYLDYLQNRRGQTLAAAYCARPKVGATVSTPLAWSEVNNNLNIKDYTIFNVPNRIEKLGDLFAGILKESTNIESVLNKLDNL